MAAAGTSDTLAAHRTLDPTTTGAPRIPRSRHAPALRLFGLRRG
ncbi:MAG TPA: hypothetical protein VJ914_01815 [Pseudonocardiaceae bacterium]|nr:hypothetical protein [Pseudonocardiaceae bacterium]